MYNYEIVIEYPTRAKGVAERIASHLQSMATNEFGITLDITLNESSDDTELQFDLRTNDLTETSLNMRNRTITIIRQQTFIRPFSVEIQYVFFAMA